MDNMYTRTTKLLGDDRMHNIKNMSIAVFGLGGVGSYVCEMLARTGVGKLIVIDCDTVSTSNINRQLIALSSTVGRKKTDVIEERLLDINPKIEVVSYFLRIDKQNINDVELTDCSYVVDAIDGVTGKLAIIKRCKELGIAVISSMGTGNKLDPTKFIITDISKTKMCPLAKVMRKELKVLGIENVDVLYSEEPPLNSERIPASVGFVPSVAGILIARHILLK